jgi:signal transduction histidine kinase
VTEPRLATVLTKRTQRVAWTALTGFALLMVVAFAAAGEFALRRTLEHSASVIGSLLGAYTDSTRAPGSVMPAALAERLVSMGGRVLITRTTTDAGGISEVYYVSPGMGQERLEGFPASATPEQMRQILLAAITQRSRWRFDVLRHAKGPFDIYIVASRDPYLIGLAALVGAVAVLLPLAAFGAGRAARQAVAATLGPLERITADTQEITPAALGTRIASPTGQAEVTALADSMNRMLDRVDRAHRALKAFTADASHELRTPLTLVRAQAQWALAHEREEAEVRDALVAIEGEVERTTKLVEELLLIARGENRQLALARVPFDLRPIVVEVKEITEAMAIEKRLAVHAEPMEPAWALGDADRTRHILLNLATNAVRYTLHGEVRFRLLKDGSMVGISVQDTGPGIAPEHLELVFDRFFRIDQSRSRELGGTGLGLAIARLLAELQEGRVTVESVVGDGSVFSLWLPASEAQVRPAVVSA